MKACTKCKMSKDVSSFYKNSKSKDGLTHECVSCTKARHQKHRKANEHKIKHTQKAWDKANPERIKGTQLRRRYWPHLSSQDAFYKYKAMYDNQNGRCAICSQFEPNIIDGLHVDHNHSSNQVRGLLCNDCNLALGCFEDSISRIKNAICYLTNSGNNL